MKLPLSLLLFFCLACSPLRQLHKVQSDKRLRKTETLNFTGEKAMTQWWYYDCVLEDGSVLVFLFTPYQWWDKKEKMPTYKSLFYFSYMYPDGRVVSEQKIFDAAQVQYNDDRIKAPCFEIVRMHDLKARNYTVSFYLDSIQGSVKINSDGKAFSPFPRGSMSSTVTSLFKRKVKGLAYRYAAHMPQGKVVCDLKLQDKKIDLSGKAYHEQGWFTGSPDRMGDGWTWFHFVSDNINVLGTPGQFFCFENTGKRLVGGLEKNCCLTEMVYAEEPSGFLTRGKLSFHSRKLSFEISPTGKASVPLICLPSDETDQLWGTVCQPSFITLSYKGKESREKGVLFLETCRMKKKKSENITVISGDGPKQ
ncbi:MAG: hypothetical protein ACJ75J_13760 [Cytophagaceae bacterium]